MYVYIYIYIYVHIYIYIYIYIHGAGRDGMDQRESLKKACVRQVVVRQVVPPDPFRGTLRGGFLGGDSFAADPQCRGASLYSRRRNEFRADPRLVPDPASAMPSSFPPRPDPGDPHTVFLHKFCLLFLFAI